jgi:hypothetical protein
MDSSTEKIQSIMEKKLKHTYSFDPTNKLALPKNMAESHAPNTRPAACVCKCHKLVEQNL